MIFILIVSLFGCRIKYYKTASVPNPSVLCIKYDCNSIEWSSLSSFLNYLIDSEKSPYVANITKANISGDTSYVVYVTNPLAGMNFGHIYGLMIFNNFEDLCKELHTLTNSQKSKFILHLSKSNQYSNDLDHLDFELWENTVIHAIILKDIQGYENNLYKYGFSFAILGFDLLGDQSVIENIIVQQGYAHGKLIYYSLKMKFPEDEESFDMVRLPYILGNFEASDVKIMIDQFLNIDNDSPRELEK